MLPTFFVRKLRGVANKLQMLDAPQIQPKAFVYNITHLTFLILEGPSLCRNALKTQKWALGARPAARRQKFPIFAVRPCQDGIARWY